MYSPPQRVLIISDDVRLPDSNSIRAAGRILSNVEPKRDWFVTSKELRCGVKENHRKIMRRAAP